MLNRGLHGGALTVTFTFTCTFNLNQRSTSLASPTSQPKPNAGLDILLTYLRYLLIYYQQHKSSPPSVRRMHTPYMQQYHFLLRVPSLLKNVREGKRGV